MVVPSFVDKSFGKDLSYADYSTSQKIFLKFEKNSIKMLDFSQFFVKFLQNIDLSFPYYIFLLQSPLPLSPLCTRGAAWWFSPFCTRGCLVVFPPFAQKSPLPPLLRPFSLLAPLLPASPVVMAKIVLPKHQPFAPLLPASPVVKWRCHAPLTIYGKGKCHTTNHASPFEKGRCRTPFSCLPLW